MKIKYRLVLIIFTITILFFSAGYFIISDIYLNQVTDFEKSRVLDKIDSTEIILKNTESDLVNTTGDWALWDDTYNFIKGQDPNYITDNLGDSSVQMLNVNAVVLFDLKKNIVYSKSFSGNFTSYKDARVLDVLTAGTDSDQAVSGLVGDNGSTWVVACRPVTTSLQDMPAVGYLLFARQIDPGMIHNIGHIINADVVLSVSDAPAAAPSFMIDSQSVSASVSLEDILGRPVISLLIQNSRDIYYKNMQAFNNISLVYLCSSLLTIFLLYHLINIYLTRPIVKMSRHLSSIHLGPDNAIKKLNMKGKNEITFISNEIDLLLDRISLSMGAEKKKREEMVYLSYHDEMTGLYNRRFFEEEYDRLDTKRQYPLSILLGDVNGLKLINDAFGHLEGDRVIRGVAKVIQDSCRAEDIIARWGGDEYIVLLPQTDEDMATQISQRIRDACAQTSYAGISISVSLGCATKTQSSCSLDCLIKSAEDLMYERKMMESQSSKNAIINSILCTLRLRSNESEEHAVRLKVLCAVMSREMGLKDEEREQLSLLAVLHDIGKIAISDAILNKNGPLSESDWREMKKHPEIGCRILQGFPELVHISEYVLLHHERWDGQGYPRGVKEDEIPLLSRIIAVIDAFDAMTHDRIYRKAMPIDMALDEIAAKSGTQFDPAVVFHMRKLRDYLLESALVLS